MEVLNQIIEKLTKEEIRNFKLFSNRSVPVAHRKDLALFDYIRYAGSKFNEQKAYKKLDYTQKNRNNYYRLKSRLTEDLGDSLMVLHAHKNELYEVLHFMQLFYFYHERNLYKACFFYLRKAERIALTIENHELLDIVYSGFIRLSANMIVIEPMEYIEKRTRNAVIMANLRKLDDILATLSYRLKVSQNFASQDKDLLKRLQAKVKFMSRHTTSAFGKNLESRIYKALSQIFVQRRNYIALEKMVKETYQKFEKQGWFDKSNHELKLQMLTYCANALFENNKLKESLEYAEKLGKEIQAFGRLHYEKYLFFYYNARVINYSILNPELGLKALDEFEKEMKRKENTYYDFFIYLNRATILYDVRRYRDSLKSLVHLYINDSYEKADKSFKLKIEVFELIVTFESSEPDTLQYRLAQVKKTFASLKSAPQFKRDFEIIQLIESLSTSPDYKRDLTIQKKIDQMLKAKFDPDEADTEIIKYNKWLTAKLKK